MLMLGALTLALVGFSFVTAQAKPGNDTSLQNTAVPTNSPVPTNQSGTNGNNNSGLNTAANASVVVWDQFCVRKIPYTLLALSPDATFEVGRLEGIVPTPVVDSNSNEISCEGVGTFRDKQVVVCRGPQLYSFTLHVNNGGSNGVEDFQVPFKGCGAIRPDADATATPIP